MKPSPSSKAATTPSRRTLNLTWPASTPPASRLGCADEQWTIGSRDIDGFDSGEAFTDTYTRRRSGRVTTGFSSPSAPWGRRPYNLLNAGAAFRWGWLSSRTAMEKSGMVPNALIEERRVSMGRATKLWEEMILPTMVEKGDTETFRQYYEMIDSNKETPPRDARLLWIRR